ncbi:hypothetical protein VIGAN_07008800, partial [Vigna angularis var. angularis]
VFFICKERDHFYWKQSSFTRSKARGRCGGPCSSGCEHEQRLPNLNSKISQFHINKNLRIKQQNFIQTPNSTT